MKKILSFLLDYDGCTDGIFMAPKPKDHPIYKRLQKIITSGLSKQPYDEVIIGSASLRQNAALDYFNNTYNENGASFTHFYILALTLATDFPNQNFKVSDILLADINRNLKFGSTMKTDTNLSNQAFTSCEGDEQKSAIIFMHAQHLSNQYKETDQIYAFYLDDRSDLCRNIYQYYNAYSQLLPKNFFLTTLEYNPNTKNIHNLYTPDRIQGSGSTLKENIWKSIIKDFLRQSILALHLHDTITSKEIMPEQNLGSEIYNDRENFQSIKNALKNNNFFKSILYSSEITTLKIQAIDRFLKLTKNFNLNIKIEKIYYEAILEKTLNILCLSRSLLSNQKYTQTKSFQTYIHAQKSMDLNEQKRASNSTDITASTDSTIYPEYFITSEHPVHLCQNVDNLSTEFNK